MVMGIGNGMGSGYRSNARLRPGPEVGRAEFLGLWQMVANSATSLVR